MEFILFLFPFLLSLIQRANSQSTCNQVYNSTHCLLCATGYAAPSSDLIIPYANCVAKLTTTYQKTYLVVMPTDSTSYTNMTFDATSNNLTALLLSEETNARKYQNPKLTIILTVGNHSLVSNKELVFFAGIDDLNFQVISYPCVGQTTCATTLYPTLTIDTTNVHFFASKTSSISFLFIKGTNGATCLTIGCSPTFIVENIISSSALTLTGVYFLNYYIEFNLAKENTIIQLGKSQSSLTFTNVVLDTCKLDSFVTQYQLTKNLLSEYVSSLYSSTISIPNTIATSTSVSGSNLTVQNHNLNIAANSNLNLTSRTFLQQAFGFIYVIDSATSFSIVNVTLSNFQAINANHIFSYLKVPCAVTLSNIQILSNSNVGFLYCFGCGTTTINPGKIDSSTINGLFTFLNLTGTASVTNFVLNGGGDTRKTMFTQFSNLIISNWTLTSFRDMAFDISGTANVTEISIIRFYVTAMNYSKKIPTLTFLNVNMTLQDIVFINPNSTVINTDLFLIQNPTRFIMEGLYINNSNVWEILKIISLSIPLVINNFTSIRNVPLQETGYIFSFGSQIMGLTLQNSLFRDHDGIVLYSSVYNKPKNITLTNVSVLNSNITDAQALLMWHLFTTTVMTNCTFNELPVVDKRYPPAQDALDLVMFFGFSAVTFQNVSFVNYGYYTWREYYLFGGTDYSFFSFFSNTNMIFRNCIFSVDDRKFNHHFLSFILTSKLIEISNSSFISTKSDTAPPAFRSCYGLNLNTPLLINITNNVFTNFYCYKFPVWNTQYITSYGPISIFDSSNTKNIVLGKVVLITNNNFTKMYCSKYGGTISILNFENATIMNNNFTNSYAPKGAFLYIKSISNLFITQNTFIDGLSNDAFVYIESVNNAQIEFNAFQDSSNKQNSQSLIATLSVVLINIKNSTFNQRTDPSQGKTAILVDTSTRATFDNVFINGSTAVNNKATALDVVRSSSVYLINSLITNTQNSNYYAVTFDTNINNFVSNTTFTQNKRRIFAFNDFTAVTIDTLIVTNNTEFSVGESVLSFESLSLGNIVVNNMNLFNNSYQQTSIIYFLTSAPMTVNNLTVNNFQGIFLYAYLYFFVPIQVTSSNFTNVQFPSSMILGLYVNLTLSNITLTNFKFNRVVIDIKSSSFNYSGIALQNVSTIGQTGAECFFSFGESSGFIQIGSINNLNLGNLICISQLSTCTITNTNSIARPDLNSFQFLTSDHSTLNVQNSLFSNYNQTLFQLSNSNAYITNTNFNSAQKTKAPIANFKEASEVAIVSSTFNVQNIIIFYLYSADIFRIENSKFVGSNISFAIFEVQSCTSLKVSSSSIASFNYDPATNYSVKSLMYASGIDSAVFDNITVSSNKLNSIPILSLKDISKLTVNNSNFTGNSFQKSIQNSEITCIDLNCQGNCHSHNISNTTFVNNIAENSFPIFFSNFLMNINSMTLSGNNGFSQSFPYLMFIPDNFDFLWNETVLKSGLSNNLQVQIYENKLKQNVIFDNFSTAIIQNNDTSVSIKLNNLAHSASNGKLLFSNLLLTALPNSTVALKLIVSLSSEKYFNPGITQVMTLEKVFKFFVRSCIFGEIYRPLDNSCIFCPTGSISIFNSKGKLPNFCQFCPDYADCAYNSSVTAKNGFWKAEGNSTLIVLCPFPSACVKTNGSKCSAGYQGTLCQRCATDYGKSLSSKQCIDCKAYADLNLALSFVYFVLFAIYAIVSTSLAIRKDESSSDSIFSLLNIVVSHYQYIAIISAGLDRLNDAGDVTFQVSNNVSVLWDVINPNLCFMNFINDYEEKFQVVYMMVIAYVTFFILIAIAITLFFAFRITFNSSKKINLFKGSKKKFIITISLFIFNFFYPSLLSVNISKLPCTLIDNYLNLSVMKTIPEIECFGSFHIFILVTMAIPGFIMLGFIIPLILFYLLLKQREYELQQIITMKSQSSFKSGGTLNVKVVDIDNKENENVKNAPVPKLQNFAENKEESMESHMSLTHFKTADFVLFIVKNRIFKFYMKGYKREFCHWEVGKLFLKFIIAIFSNLETVIDVTYIRLILFFVFFIYMNIHIKSMPYKHRYGNRLEWVSLTICLFYLILTINNLSGIAYSIFKICQMIGNAIFLFCFVLGVGILSAHVAKEKYTQLTQSISKTLAKKRSQRSSTSKSKKSVQSNQIMIK